MIRYMEDVTTATEEQLRQWAKQIRQERMRRRGQLITCQQCQAHVVARKDARFCSTRCRVAAFRAAKVVV